MRDNLPHYSTSGKPGSMIINTDKESGSGIHWIAIYDSPESKTIEYFDPFGMIPLPEVEKYMRSAHYFEANQKMKKRVLYNNRQLQNVRSNLCGWYCMYYIIERSKGRSPYSVIMDFTQHPSEQNENMIDGFGQIISSKFFVIDNKKIHGGSLGDFLNNFSLNEMISNLPFEAHLIDRGDDGRVRKSSFIGPGTKFTDRVKLDDYGNIIKIITPPINKLDAGAMEHDRVYTLYSDVDNRNIADLELKKIADDVYKHSHDRLQRANALLVGLIMKTKIKYNI